jgi:hypothetical protein
MHQPLLVGPLGVVERDTAPPIGYSDAKGAKAPIDVSCIIHIAK